MIKRHFNPDALKFLRFIKENECFKGFRENTLRTVALRMQYGIVTPIDVLSKIEYGNRLSYTGYTRHLLVNMFAFANTPEGFTFWYDLNNKWHSISFHDRYGIPYDMNNLTKE